MKNCLYLNKNIKTPGDLAPRGIGSTYDKEKFLLTKNLKHNGILPNNGTN
jgi:hypothetical protein